MSEAKMKSFTVLRNPGGLTDAAGFKCAGVKSGIRSADSDRLDLGLVYADVPCNAAAVFTTNRVVAAPVKLSRARLKEKGPFHGIVFNSGNANACTGEQGMADAQAMLWAAETAMEAPSGSFFVASTGRIGRDLPMRRILPGIELAASVAAATKSAGQAAADCILTSDTRRKAISIQVKTSEGTYTIAGIAKGAGMIQPNMATMLAFITTDADVSSRRLQKLLKQSVGPSFNSITVDGDASTNDTVIALANGVSGIRIKGELKAAFAEGFQYICTELARLIVGDGEKVTKVVEICVTGAADTGDADKVARAIGNSLLVKSSWYGNDPNWGRILDAAGYAGADLVEDKVSLAYRSAKAKRSVPVFASGREQSKNLAKWKTIVSAETFVIELDLGLGRGAKRLLASDLTDGYVNFNKSE